MAAGEDVVATRLVRRRAARRVGERSGEGRLRRAARPAIGVVAFFLVCEAFTRLELVNPRFLPPASTILARFFGLFGNGDFWHNVSATMQAWAFGVGLAVAIAVPLGIVLGRRASPTA